MSAVVVTAVTAAAAVVAVVTAVTDAAVVPAAAAAMTVISPGFANSPGFAISPGFASSPGFAISLGFAISPGFEELCELGHCPLLKLAGLPPPAASLAPCRKRRKGSADELEPKWLRIVFGAAAGPWTATVHVDRGPRPYTCDRGPRPYTCRLTFPTSASW